MSDQTVVDLPTLRKKFAAAVAMLVAVLLVVIMLVVFWFDEQSEGPKKAENVAKQNDVTEQVDVSATPLKSPLPNASSPVDEDTPERMGILKSRKAQTAAEIELRADQIDQLSGSLHELNSTLTSLRSNDKGRRIAADPELIEVYMAICEQSPAIPTNFDALKVELNALRAKVDFVRNWHQRHSLDDHVRRADEIVAPVISFESTIKQHRLRIDGLISLAQPKALANQTLEQAIHSHEASLAAARDLQRARIRRETREAELTKETELAKELNDKIAVIEQEIAASRKRVELSEVESRKAKQQRQEEKLRLEQDFAKDRAEIESLLKPFITPGRKQDTGSRNGYQLSRDPTPRPVSFSRIKGLGYLANDRDALHDFWWSTRTNNDRPLGSFPGPGRGLEPALPALRRAQELLIRYGDLLVEKGMLSP